MCYQVMQHTHRLKALPNVVDETGIPQSVRDQHLALCTVTTTLRAYIDSTDFLPEVWRPAAAWDVPNLSSSVPYLIAHDALAAARQVRREFSHVWATAVTDTCTALESVTPQWQVNSLDLFSKASGDIITGMMEGGSWTWPDPTALPTSNKLVTIMNQLKRLGKVGGQVVPAGLLLQGKSVALHCSDTSAAMYVFHVLFKVLPALSDPELRSTAAATLKEQVSGKCYNLPGLLRDASRVPPRRGMPPRSVQFVRQRSGDHTHHHYHTHDISPFAIPWLYVAVCVVVVVWVCVSACTFLVAGPRRPHGECALMRCPVIMPDLWVVWHDLSSVLADASREIQSRGHTPLTCATIHAVAAAATTPLRHTSVARSTLLLP